MRVLVVEDDSSLGRLLTRGLEVEHFAVDLVTDGGEALAYVSEIDYDIVVLDLELLKLDGLAVLQRVRNKRLQMPVMVLSGRDDLEDRVGALEAGADDYVVKPLVFSEVLARINALLRRPRSLQDKLKVADLEIDRARRIVTRSGKPIRLTLREYALLEYLMRNAGHPVSRTMALEHVWNERFEGLTNIVDVYVNYLRNKVDKGYQVKLHPHRTRSGLHPGRVTAGAGASCLNAVHLRSRPGVPSYIEAR